MTNLGWARWGSADLDWVWLTVTPHPVFFLLLLGTMGKYGHILLIEMKKYRRASPGRQVLFQASASIMSANIPSGKVHLMVELNFKGQEKNTCNPFLGGAVKSHCKGRAHREGVKNRGH